MKSITQKNWRKPELIVLTRSKPEEAVLAACKTTNYGPGPGVLDKHCHQWPAACRTNASS
jgi:hypothetical protein